MSKNNDEKDVINESVDPRREVEMNNMTWVVKVNIEIQSYVGQGAQS